MKSPINPTRNYRPDSKEGADSELRVSDWLTADHNTPPAPVEPEATEHTEPTHPAPEQDVAAETAPSSKQDAPVPARKRTVPITQLQPVAPVSPEQEQRPRPRSTRVQPIDPSLLLEGYSARRPAAAFPQAMPLRTEAAPIAAETSLEEDQMQPLPFDFFRFLGGIVQRKVWLFLFGLAGLALGFLFGFERGDSYAASTILIFRDVPTSFSLEGEASTGRTYKPKDFDKPTLSKILVSDALLQRVAPKLHPRMNAQTLATLIDFQQERGADFIELTFSGGVSPHAAVDAVNTWAREAVQFTKELQAAEARESRFYLQREDLKRTINQAKQDLTNLRAKFSDQNPLVREKLSEINSLESRLKANEQELKDLPPLSEDQSMENALGYFSIMSPATVEAVSGKSRWLKGAAFGTAGMLAAIFMVIGMAVCWELLRMNRVIRTTKELELAIREKTSQKVPRIPPNSLGAGEVSSIWTRILGSAPKELICFWIPYVHEQPDLVIQALVDLSSKHDFPLLWVDTGGTEIRLPRDFREIKLNEISKPFDPGRYVLKINLHTLTTGEADHLGQALVEMAARQRMQVWLGLQGQVLEPISLVRHAHRVKVLAALNAASREFWQNRRDQVRQGVPCLVEWLAVNFVPWYRW